MIQLFLNEQEVYTQEKTSIKLIKENPLLTKSGSSTFNISIPMRIEQNVKVLGHLNRIDYMHRPITFTAKLLCDNVTLITGEAVVTEVTERLVKVQILGGTSLMNFYNRMETLYIDELDLGKWGFSYTGIDVAKTWSYSFFYTSIWMEYKSKKLIEGEDRAQEYLISKLFGGSDWVAFPIYNETSEVMCNDWIFRVFWRDGLWQYGKNGLYVEPRNNIDASLPNGYPQVRFAVQPYLLPMIKRVFQALGYSVDMTSVENNDLFKKIFIASAHEYSSINKSLPHWSVKEFITQLEYFLGVVFVCDEDAKNIVVIRRTDFVKQNQYVIEDVVDEFTVSNNDDENILLSSANVGFAEVDKYAKLEPWILENAKQKHYKHEGELFTDIWDKKPGDTTTGYQLYHNDYKGHLLFIDNNEIRIAKAMEDDFNVMNNICIVNHLRDRIVNSNNNDLDVELKIIPVKINNRRLISYYTNENNQDMLFDSVTNYSYYMSSPDYPVRGWEEAATTEENIIRDVDMAICGEETLNETERDDFLRVAINDGAFSLHVLMGKDTGKDNSKYPKPLVYSNKNEYDINGDFKKGFVGLNVHDMPKMKTLATEVFDSEPKINTDVLYCIKFITSKLMNVDYKFIIRNQTYICKKLEYQAKESGLEKIVTGYFYRLEE